MAERKCPLKRPVEDKEVEYLINNAEYNTVSFYGRCTVVICKLPNDFIIVESSTCVNEEDYDEEIGVENCCRRIIDKVYELVGYNRCVDKKVSLDYEKGGKQK